MSPHIRSEHLRRSPLSQAWRSLVQGARLAVGIPDYGAYLEHMRRTHPGAAPMDEATFFRERLQARYGRGRSRCC
ncbi:YbdD/YjiX family protein [Cognatilysobacter terrigena]|uniref:YbdD/YjiX family protein n=1 Tax=Cognatilysobacter terrigena TaxID=2488749 RepID=UPI00106117E0|nr:YbdD/YjiX family protein [Lysobacter terrigena]